MSWMGDPDCFLVWRPKERPMVKTALIGEEQRMGKEGVYVDSRDVAGLLRTIHTLSEKIERLEAALQAPLKKGRPRGMDLAGIRR